MGLFLFNILQKMKIMKSISCLLVSVFLFSCGNKSAVSKKLTGADSLVITFNVPDSDTIINTVSSTEKKAIRKLSGFLDGKESKLYKCGFDGNMVFFKQGQMLLPVVFKYSDAGCRTFMYELDNKVMSREMGNEAMNFLKSLVEGKGWY